VKIDALTPTSVEVTVTLFNNNEFISAGHPAFAFNLANAPTITSETTLTSGFTFDGDAPGSLHDDGLGTFEYGFDCMICSNGGSNPQPGPLVFDLMLSSVITPDSFVSDGTAFFGVDILSGQTGQTGPVGANTLASEVPEQASLIYAMVGMVLLCLGYRTSRRLINH
jgi:hypothetical protein